MKFSHNKCHEILFVEFDKFAELLIEFGHKLKKNKEILLFDLFKASDVFFIKT